MVCFDALRVKFRDEGVARHQAVYLALSVAPDGSVSPLIRARLPAIRDRARLRTAF
jgi:hypothetical protein